MTDILHSLFVVPGGWLDFLHNTTSTVLCSKISYIH